MKRIYLITLFLFICIHNTSFAQGYSEPCFPVKATTENKDFHYMIDCKDPQTVKKYEAIFKKNNFKMKPEVLQGILEQSVEKFDASLAKDVTMAVNDSQLWIEVKKSAKEKFFQFECGMFSSTKKLDDYMQKVDRSQIESEDE